jgi:hypothetical protein
MLAEGVHWDWIELLEFLVSSWHYLVYEEAYPVNLNPSHPGKLRTLASRRWETMSESLSLEEEEEVYCFEGCHDLADGLNGIFLPTVFLLREGNKMWVGTEEKYYLLCSFAETRQTLEDLGNLIGQRLEELTDPRAQLALSQWRNRDKNLSPEQRIAVVTGLSKEELQELQANNTLEQFWEYPAANQASFEITELQAAARMMRGKLSIANMQTVLERIRSIQLVNTPELDKLSQRAVAFLQNHAEEEFYEQGYHLATWLREQLNLNSHGKVAPKALLTQWGVWVQELEELPEKGLDAIACWGPRHGPAVLLNLKSLRNQKPSGRYATYAHEICHLLVDREGSLPLGEIFGGHLPGGAERRANAFAAELLLPRSVAAEAVRTKKEPLAHLSSKYGVSYHLAANQILNSTVAPELTLDQHNDLERLREKYSEGG